MQREKNAEKVNPGCVPPLLQLALQLVEEDRGAGGDACAYSTLNIDPRHQAALHSCSRWPELAPSSLFPGEVQPQARSSPLFFFFFF